MVFARFLSDSKKSDHEPFSGVDFSHAPPPQRAVARARPKRPRKPSIQSLRAQKEAYELVLKHLPYVLRDLDDASSSTPINSTDSEEDDATIAGDEDAQRICAFLRRTVVLSRQAQEEIAKRTEYLRLLKRHYEGTSNLQKLMRGLRLDDWFWMCERWRSLGLEHYQPLSAFRCYAIMQETLQAIKTHRPPVGTSETEAFGWCDWHHLDDDGHYVRFMTRKTMEHADMKQLVDHSWSIYSDGDLFKTAHLGDNCEFFLQILQPISTDVMVLQRVERYPNLDQLTHSLVIVFRVQTETGYMIVFRCIESPRLQQQMKADGLSLGGSFFWETFDIAHQDAQGECDAVTFTLAGSIGSDNPTYARRWRDQLLAALVRYETRYLDASILSIESVTEGDKDATTYAATDPTGRSHEDVEDETPVDETLVYDYCAPCDLPPYCRTMRAETTAHALLTQRHRWLRRYACDFRFNVEKQRDDQLQDQHQDQRNTTKTSLRTMVEASFDGRQVPVRSTTYEDAKYMLLETADELESIAEEVMVAPNVALYSSLMRWNMYTRQLHFVSPIEEMKCSENNLGI